MAPRAYWKGYLKLVSCPIALFPATSEREKISFHQINKNTGHRIKYRKVDADTGDEVGADDIIKGYEVGKGQYIELQTEELEAVAIESKRTIEIDKFVPRDEIDEIFFDSPYYIVPDGEVGGPGLRNQKGGHGRPRQSRFHVARARHSSGAPRKGSDGRHAPISVRGPEGNGLF
jgi:Ku protein